VELRERIRAEFDSHAIISTEVPEWGEGDQPLEVFAKPITLAELSKIQKYAGSDEAMLSVYTVLFKALNSDGEPLFKLSDKSLLMNGANAAVVGRLANWILTADRAAAAAEK
jgi:hypothetical protein